MDDALHIRPVKTDGRSSASASTSSRAAANLSMERLYRKRAIDRENQRVLRQKNKARLAELEAEVRGLTERLAQAEADKAQAAARTQTSSTSLDGIIASLRSLQVSLAVATAESSAGGSAHGSSPGSSPLTTTASPVSNVAARTTSVSSLSPSPASLQPDGKHGQQGQSGQSVDQPMGGTQPYAGDTVTLNLDNLDFWGSGASVTVPVDDSIPFQNSDFSLDIDLLTRSLPLFSADLPNNQHGQPPSQHHQQSNHQHPPNSAQSAHPPRPPTPTQLHPHHYPQFSNQLPPLASEHQSGYPFTQGYVYRNPPGSIDFTAPSPPAPSAAGDSFRRNPHDDTGAVYLARVEANRLRDASPVWAVTPPYVPPTSNVDELIINLVYKRRRGQTVAVPSGTTATPATRSLSTASATTAATSTSAASTGSTTPSASTSASTAATSPSDEFTHAHFPSVNSLLNPVLYEPDRPVASTIARHVAGTIMVYTTPEKTALLYMMCIYIRWLIAPTREHYDAIPEFFRPTGAQLVVPHPFWIDTLGWPRVRERLVSHLDHTRYRDFASIIVKSFSIGWPHNALEGILEASPEPTADGKATNYVMTKAFVQHVREPKNWTVGPELVEAFPFLEGAVNVRGRPPVSF